MVYIQVQCDKAEFEDQGSRMFFKTMNNFMIQCQRHQNIRTFYSSLSSKEPAINWQQQTQIHSKGLINEYDQRDVPELERQIKRTRAQVWMKSQDEKIMKPRVILLQMTTDLDNDIYKDDNEFIHLQVAKFNEKMESKQEDYKSFTINGDNLIAPSIKMAQEGVFQMWQSYVRKHRKKLLQYCQSHDISRMIQLQQTKQTFQPQRQMLQMCYVGYIQMEEFIKIDFPLAKGKQFSDFIHVMEAYNYKYKSVNYLKIIRVMYLMKPELLELTYFKRFKQIQRRDLIPGVILIQTAYRRYKYKQINMQKQDKILSNVNPDDLFELMTQKIQSSQQSLKEIFEIIDINKDRKITFQEFVKAFQDSKITFPEEVLRAVFDHFDLDGSGTIQYMEFLSKIQQKNVSNESLINTHIKVEQYLQLLRNAMKREFKTFEECFNQLQAQDRLKVNNNEFQSFVKKYTLRFSTVQLDSIFHYIDSKQKGYLNIEDFSLIFPIQQTREQEEKSQNQQVIKSLRSQIEDQEFMYHHIQADNMQGFIEQRNHMLGDLLKRGQSQVKVNTAQMAQRVDVYKNQLLKLEIFIWWFSVKCNAKIKESGLTMKQFFSQFSLKFPEKFIDIKEFTLMLKVVLNDDMDPNLIMALFRVFSNTYIKRISYNKFIELIKLGQIVRPIQLTMKYRYGSHLIKLSPLLREDFQKQVLLSQDLKSLTLRQSLEMLNKYGLNLEQFEIEELADDNVIIMRQNRCMVDCHLLLGLLFPEGYIIEQVILQQYGHIIMKLWAKVKQRYYLNKAAGEFIKEEVAKKQLKLQHQLDIKSIRSEIKDAEFMYHYFQAENMSGFIEQRDQMLADLLKTGQSQVKVNPSEVNQRVNIYKNQLLKLEIFIQQFSVKCIAQIKESGLTMKQFFSQFSLKFPEKFIDAKEFTLMLNVVLNDVINSDLVMALFRVFSNVYIQRISYNKFVDMLKLGQMVSPIQLRMKQSYGSQIIKLRQLLIENFQKQVLLSQDLKSLTLIQCLEVLNKYGLNLELFEIQKLADDNVIIMREKCYIVDYHRLLDKLFPERYAVEQVILQKYGHIIMEFWARVKKRYYVNKAAGKFTKKQLSKKQPKPIGIKKNLKEKVAEALPTQVKENQYDRMKQKEVYAFAKTITLECVEGAVLYAESIIQTREQQQQSQKKSAVRDIIILKQFQSLDLPNIDNINFDSETSRLYLNNKQGVLYTQDISGNRMLENVYLGTRIPFNKSFVVDLVMGNNRVFILKSNWQLQLFSLAQKSELPEQSLDLREGAKNAIESFKHLYFYENCIVVLSSQRTHAYKISNSCLHIMKKFSLEYCVTHQANKITNALIKSVNELVRRTNDKYKLSLAMSLEQMEKIEKLRRDALDFQILFNDTRVQKERLIQFMGQNPEIKQYFEEISDEEGYITKQQFDEIFMPDKKSHQSIWIAVNKLRDSEINLRQLFSTYETDHDYLNQYALDDMLKSLGLPLEQSRPFTNAYSNGISYSQLYQFLNAPLSMDELRYKCKENNIDLKYLFKARDPFDVGLIERTDFMAVLESLPFNITESEIDHIAEQQVYDLESGRIKYQETQLQQKQRGYSLAYILDLDIIIYSVTFPRSNSIYVSNDNLLALLEGHSKISKLLYVSQSGYLLSHSADIILIHAVYKDLTLHYSMNPPWTLSSVAQIKCFSEIENLDYLSENQLIVAGCIEGIEIFDPVNIQQSTTKQLVRIKPGYYREQEYSYANTILPKIHQLEMTGIKKLITGILQTPFKDQDHSVLLTFEFLIILRRIPINHSTKSEMCNIQLYLVHRQSIDVPLTQIDMPIPVNIQNQIQTEIMTMLESAMRGKRANGVLGIEREMTKQTLRAHTYRNLISLSKQLMLISNGVRIQEQIIQEIVHASKYNGGLTLSFIYHLLRSTQCLNPHNISFDEFKHILLYSKEYQVDNGKLRTKEELAKAETLEQSVVLSIIDEPFQTKSNQKLYENEIIERICGVINQNQMSLWKSVFFEKYHISAQQFQVFLANIGVPQTPIQTRNLIKQLDRKSDGTTLQYSELITQIELNGYTILTDTGNKVSVQNQLLEKFCRLDLGDRNYPDQMTVQDFDKLVSLEGTKKVFNTREFQTLANLFTQNGLIQKSLLQHVLRTQRMNFVDHNIIQKQQLKNIFYIFNGFEIVLTLIRSLRKLYNKHIETFKTSESQYKRQLQSLVDALYVKMSKINQYINNDIQLIQAAVFNTLNQYFTSMYIQPYLQFKSENNRIDQMQFQMGGVFIGAIPESQLVPLSVPLIEGRGMYQMNCRLSATNEKVVVTVWTVALLQNVCYDGQLLRLHVMESVRLQSVLKNACKVCGIVEKKTAMGVELQSVHFSEGVSMREVCSRMGGLLKIPKLVLSGQMILVAKHWLKGIIEVIYEINSYGYCMPLLRSEIIQLTDSTVKIADVQGVQSTSLGRCTSGIDVRVLLALYQTDHNELSLAPELQTKPLKEITDAVDSWQFGLLIFELLFGNRPQSVSFQSIEPSDFHSGDLLQKEIFGNLASQLSDIIGEQPSTLTEQMQLQLSQKSLGAYLQKLFTTQNTDPQPTPQCSICSDQGTSFLNASLI